MPEANQVERRGRGQFEWLIAAHPFREFLRQTYVLANVMLQSLDPVVANHKPELQRPEPASQLNVPVAVIDDGSRFRGLVAQILGQNTQSLNQRLAVGHP